MKKFLSLVLAAVMLLSCTGAMAASDLIKNTTHTDWDTSRSENLDADLNAYDKVNVADDAAYDTEGEMATELWLQVSADGQIDVTVPLVLVFQTNIDGGTAKTGNRYRIYNNNNAEIVVTQMEFEKTNINNPMQMMEYTTAVDSLQENQYKAQISVENTDASISWEDPSLLEPTQTKLVLNKTILNGKPTFNTYLKRKSAVTDTLVSDIKNNGIYDMYYYSYQKPAKEGGLFKLDKIINGGDTPTTTFMRVDMSTGPMTFVTQTKPDSQSASGEAFDQTKGVHLLTVTYTVAIDTHNQYGQEIKGANGQELVAYTGKIQEVNSSGSGTIPAEITGEAGQVNPQNIASNDGGTSSDGGDDNDSTGNSGNE